MVPELLEVKMHPHLSHGKCLKKEGAVELSWIQPLYCLQHIVHLALVNPSELGLLNERVEDRYFRIKKDFARIISGLLSITGQIYCRIH